MSDAQWPPDARDGESNPPGREAGPLSERGGIVVTLNASGDGVSKAPTALPADTDVDREANGSASLFHDAHTGSPASEADFDDSQPMLDLRFPEPAPEGAAEPPISEFDASASGRSDGLEVHASAQESPERVDADEPESDVREVLPAVEKLVEISPIFSALDAAERAADEAMPQTNVAPQIDAFEVGILLPVSRLADGEDADAEVVSLQALEPSAGDLPGVEEKTEPEAAAEPVASDSGDADAAGPSEQQGERSAELLQDAAARIAAEATATAAALENLKRLLVHKLPEPEIPANQPEPQKAVAERTEPPPVPAYRPPVHLPVEPPPMVAAVAAQMSSASMSFAGEEPVRRTGLAVGSFLAGFALSWVMGAVLYVFLTAG